MGIRGGCIRDCITRQDGKDFLYTVSFPRKADVLLVQVKIWQRLEGAQKWVAVATIQANAAATAVAFAPDRGRQES